jgi:hypothetical protein
MERFLRRAVRGEYMKVLDHFGRQGVAALASATPVDTGETASSWDYEVKLGNTTGELIFTNSHVHRGLNIAIILQYGHGTGTGGYVQGIDYINPALRPVFEDLLKAIEKAVNE